MLFAAATPGYAQSGSEGLYVSQRQLVESKRIGRTGFEYTLRLTLGNSGTKSYTSARVATSTTASNVQVVDGQADFGTIGPGEQRVASDDIVVRVDRAMAITEDWLRYAIQGVPVVTSEPTVPLPGIDANTNGVRDDVEAVISSWFSSDSRKKVLAMDIAKAKQTATVNLSELSDMQVRQLHEGSVVAAICLMEGGEDVVDLLATIQGLQFNTPQRRAAMRAYEERLAGLGLLTLPSDEIIAARCASV